VSLCRHGSGGFPPSRAGGETRHGWHGRKRDQGSLEHVRDEILGQRVKMHGIQCLVSRRSYLLSLLDSINMPSISPLHLLVRYKERWRDREPVGTFNLIFHLIEPP
jgi:hypothetical protein